LQGLLASEDVQLALDVGVDGIAVSNHGAAAPEMRLLTQHVRNATLGLSVSFL